MFGSPRRLQIAPGESGKKVLTIRLRVQVTLPTSEATVQVGDVLAQAGGIASGWVPHVTEMPWMAGVVGG